ncbi:nucleotidyltransferase family protein [Xanthomonas euvesicatoria]|uniref:nucleotidyltransferase family protein n=1 Tax=Xanthomonas euvesicatoria TaxID=456327 RepID=UPI001C47C85C|nr:nucleotidyltransferase family protein [Xanthomonas euvesicatoria]MBV6848774.1 nucleotidyltransferase family protein [Xanthomonas campestris pv. heliotropii]
MHDSLPTAGETGQHPVVIVLAAGRGQRFACSGGVTHKLDALLGGLPVLERVLRSVAASGLPYHVVQPASGRSVETDGMGDSIARGVTATANAAGWLILPGDLPLVRTQSLTAVAQGLATHPVVLPIWNRRQGHPVGFGRDCRAALMALGGDEGAAAIVRAHRQAGMVLALQLNDPGIAMDIDTLDDLARAERLLAAGSETQDTSHGKR